MKEHNIIYNCGDATCEGFFACVESVGITDSTALSLPRPGVLIIHQFYGLTDYERSRARMLAELGYAAFAADIYGAQVRPATREEASAAAGRFRAEPELLLARLEAGLATLAAQPEVDAGRLAALGYCFGGRAALELARSGADLRAAVSFHGGLGTASPAPRGQMRASILALHGADDPHIPDEQVAAFVKEMREAEVDWQLVHYGGALHSFTEKGAGNDPSRGAAYHPLADSRSWQLAISFLAERLAGG